jgi:glutathione S-transferase
MWTLRTASASPFGRKARIAAAVCGLSDRILIETADTADPSDALRKQNPLGKIPTLLLEDGRGLYDSRVIVEFFDATAGGGVIIPSEEGRFEVLAMQALADGIMDAAVLQIYETRFRSPETHNERWIETQRGKVARALASFEAGPPTLRDPPHVGQIALACALGYLDFRFAGAWRADHARLVKWIGEFADRVPAFGATAPG